MYIFEGTEIKILVFIRESFLKRHSSFTTFLTISFFGKSIISWLWLIDILTGARKNKFIHNKRGESLRSLLNKKRKREGLWNFFLKVKHNFQKFSKMEQLVKRTIAFTLKTVCKIIVLIVKFPQIFKCSTKSNCRKL